VTGVGIMPAGVMQRDVLATLQAACSEEAWGADFIARLLATPGVFALLAAAAADPARPVGYALSRAAAGEAEVLSIGVLDAARRRGVGRALMTAVAAAAVRRGAASLFLEVAEDNAAALALYESLGFRHVGRRPGYYRRPAGPVDARILRLQLPG
jgi:ribosomal-protein-alanine N-acetyltransferase